MTTTPQEAVDAVTTSDAYNVQESEPNIFQVWDYQGGWVVLIDASKRKGVFYPDKDAVPVTLSELECSRILNDVNRRENAS